MLCVASTGTLNCSLKGKDTLYLSVGLAAQNLEGGRTAHSRFKIPIPVMEDSTCSIRAQSALAKLIKKSDLIIWDEIFSCDRKNLECLERTFRDLMDSKDLFGGKVICLEVIHVRLCLWLKGEVEQKL